MNETTLTLPSGGANVGETYHIAHGSNKGVWKVTAVTSQTMTVEPAGNRASRRKDHALWRRRARKGKA